jgi:DUF1009 family protein
MSTKLLLIAGKGAYPLELARSAREQGMDKLVVIAFKGETCKELESLCDKITWLHVGHLASFREACTNAGVSQAVMAGQITPSNLFLARFDKPMRELLAGLPKKNADTIFGAVADELAALGIKLLPAHRFLESCQVPPGCLTGREPNKTQWADIRQGVKLASACAMMQAGQSVAVKNGTVIAVEGFEGTDEMILRAGKLAGSGCVVVKVAQQNHDSRWDIPVVGLNTLKSLKKAKCSSLAIEADQVIVLERDELVRNAEEAGISIVAVKAE